MVDNKDLTPGTIAISNDGKIAIITQIKPRNTQYPIIYKFKTGTKGYKGNGSDFQAILGMGDLDKFTANDSPAPRATVGYDDDFMVPDQLKGIKIGDTITIRSRSGVEQVEYLGYNSRRPKNCVSFRKNGQNWKGPLSMIVQSTPSVPKSPVKSKRSEREIMMDILNVYCGLSPENLTCDGEASRSQVQKRSRELNNNLKDLFQEIGRKVSEEEVYGLVR